MFACNFVSLYVKSLLKFDKCNRRGTARAESPHATDEVTRNCRRLTRYSANLATTDGHVVSSTTTARRWSASVSRSWMDPARGAGSRRSSHGGERPVMQSIAAAVGHDDDVDVIAMRVVAVCRRGPVQSSPLSHVTRCRRPSSLPVADSRCTTRTAPPSPARRTCYLLPPFILPAAAASQPPRTARPTHARPVSRSRCSNWLHCLSIRAARVY